MTEAQAPFSRILAARDRQAVLAAAGSDSTAGYGVGHEGRLHRITGSTTAMTAAARAGVALAGGGGRTSARGVGNPANYPSVLGIVLGKKKGSQPFLL